MNLKRLKIIVDKTLEVYHKDPADVPLKITLSGPSLGGRLGCDVSHVGMGFDWEAGQFRIEPKHKLVTKKANGIGRIQSPFAVKEGGRTAYFCPVCDQKIAKRDKFCRWCGQRLTGGK